MSAPRTRGLVTRVDGVTRYARAVVLVEVSLADVKNVQATVLAETQHNASLPLPARTPVLARHPCVALLEVAGPSNGNQTGAGYV